MQDLNTIQILLSDINRNLEQIADELGRIRRQMQ